MHRRSRLAPSLLAVLVGLLVTAAAGGKRPREVRAGETMDFRAGLPPDEALRRLTQDAAWSPGALLAYLPLRLAPVAVQLATEEEPRGLEDHGRDEAWPACVRARFAEALADVPLGAWRGVTLDGTELYLVAVENGVSRDALVTARDPWLDRSTPCVLLSGRWTQMERGGPLPVSQVDLDGDGRMELAFGTVEHNGTVQDDELLEHFELAPDTELRPVLRPVLRLCASQWVSVYSRGEDGYVRRALARTYGRLVARVWYENPRFGLPPAPLGDLELTRRAPGEPYAPGARRVLLPGAEGWLER